MLVGHFPDRIPRIDNGTLNHMGRQGTIDHHLLGVDAYLDLGLLIQLPYRIRNRDNTLITADPFHLKFIHGARLLKPMAFVEHPEQNKRLVDPKAKSYDHWRNVVMTGDPGAESQN